MAKKSSSKDMLSIEGTGTLSIRFTPKLRYQIEIAGRLERRNLSNFIEDCIHRILQQQPWPEHGEQPSVGEFIENYLWSVQASDRLVKLGIHAPNLLEYEEQRIWALITELPGLWETEMNRFGLPSKPYHESKFNFLKLRDNWDKIVKVAKGELKKEVLSISLLEYEIPF
jgi:hypothetical protein